MTDLRSLSDVTLAAILEDDKYLSQAPHNAVLDNDTLTFNVSKGKGWVSVTKDADGIWISHVYRGERGDASEGIYYDMLDQQWLDESDARRRNGRLSERELLRALGLEVDDEEKSEAALALYVVQEWIRESLWAADTTVTYFSTLQRVPSLRLTQAGGMCPFQAEGTLDGYPFYFRYRGGGMALRVGAKGDAEASYFKPLYSSSMVYGDEYGGSLSPKEFEETFTQLVKELKRSPIWWDFAGNFTKDYLRDKKGDPSKMGAWGHTAEEAWESLNSRVSDYVTPEAWTDYMETHGTRFEPLTVDDRVFPDADPDFTVLD